MSINIPPLPRAINKIILDMTQVDILPSEKIIGYFFPAVDDEDEPINDFFD